MAKRFRNKWGLWTAFIYILAVLALGIFSVGEAFLASSTIKGLFFTAILPFVIIVLIINFFVGYGLGLILEELWRRFK